MLFNKKNSTNSTIVNDYLISFPPIDKIAPMLIVTESIQVSDNYQTTLGACKSHIHAARVFKKAKISLVSI
jgi:hypothetical protein